MMDDVYTQTTLIGWEEANKQEDAEKPESDGK
jgi:hypothetical protein